MIDEYDEIIQRVKRIKRDISDMFSREISNSIKNFNNNRNFVSMQHLTNAIFYLGQIHAFDTELSTLFELRKLNNNSNKNKSKKSKK